MLPISSMRLRNASAPLVGHRYWRLNITANAGGTNVGVAEIEFLDAAGDHISTSGGTASASTTASGTSASNAFNGDGTASSWGATSPPTQWIAMDFGSGHAADVKGVAITARTEAGANNEAPGTFDLQYSDDGSSWNTLDTYSSIATWAGGEIKEFIHDGHRYWRLYVTKVGNMSQRIFALGAAGFFLHAGASESSALTRGTKTAACSNQIQGLSLVFSSSSGETSNASAFADNGLSTTGPWWLSIDMKAGTRFKPREIFLYPQPNSPENTQRTPVDFKIQYSDDNSTWTDYKSITGYSNAWTISTLVRINVDP